MKESVTYQAIIEEGEAKGRLDEARRLVLRAGNRRLGPVTPGAQTLVDSLVTVEQLETLHDRVMEIESWDELRSNDEQ